jgi:acyl-coenzyme A synthetase/AMP-(fatty) acid ligase
MRTLFAGFGSDDMLAWRAAGSLSVAHALDAARCMTGAFSSARYAINLCERLDNFLVGAIAALIAGRTLVLPSTRLTSALSDLRVRYPANVCLTDDVVEDGETMLAVKPWIDAALRRAQPRIDIWPAIPDEHLAAILFTSGSTGTPRAHEKTWAELTEGAVSLMRSVGTPSAGTAILGTVPCQHMFGLETTVIFPLQAGTPVIAVRPTFAADLADVLAKTRVVAPSGVWLMTTPLQLRACHREYPALAGVASVASSTMPLEPALARMIERDWQTPVREIYGCTEGGILAVRRPASESAWTPAAGVTFDIASDGVASVRGCHLRGKLVLADRLSRTEGTDAFELIGRDADLVKVAGKRSSLSELTTHLLSISGVQDGVIFLPSDDAQRLAAVVVAPGLTNDALRRDLARRIDPAFLPRPIAFVDALPRSAAGKLPLAALREIVLRVPRAAAKGARRELTAQKSFDPSHPALRGHFPDRPIVPGVLLLASVEELLLDAGLRVIECVNAKFLVPLLPQQQVTIRIDVDDDIAARFEIVGAERTVATGIFRCSLESGTR